MIDLKKIEERIDRTLAHETKESLAGWLMSKRHKSLNQLLGDGTFESMEYQSSSFEASHSVVVGTDEAPLDSGVKDTFLFAA